MNKCERCGNPTLVDGSVLLIADRLRELGCAICGDCIALIVKEWIMRKRELKEISGSEAEKA